MERQPCDQTTAPVLLRAAGHPLRWRLLGELAASDRQVQELTARVGQPQNLVSYHLGQLRRAHLVTARRSSADGRDTYYRLDLARCVSLLADAGGALHPALRLVPPPAPTSPAGRDPARVLFVCTGNSSRSQMAEAFLRHRSAPAVQARSAGTHPKPVHPHAVTVMGQYGIDLTKARSKHLDTFAGDQFDYVITLCDRAREACPQFRDACGAEPSEQFRDACGAEPSEQFRDACGAEPSEQFRDACGAEPSEQFRDACGAEPSEQFRSHQRTAHWSMPDPANDPDGYPAFERVAAEIAERIGFLLYRIATEHVLEVS